MFTIKILLQILWRDTIFSNKLKKDCIKIT